MEDDLDPLRVLQDGGVLVQRQTCDGEEEEPMAQWVRRRRDDGRGRTGLSHEVCAIAELVVFFPQLLLLESMRNPNVHSAQEESDEERPCLRLHSSNLLHSSFTVVESFSQFLLHCRIRDIVDLPCQGLHSALSVIVVGNRLLPDIERVFLILVVLLDPGR